MCFWYINFGYNCVSLFYLSLKVGGQLLPDLIEFYYWLHTHLAYQLTHRMAYNTLTIGRVVHLATNRMPHSLAENIKELYKRVKSKCQNCMVFCQYILYIV